MITFYTLLIICGLIISIGISSIIVLLNDKLLYRLEELIDSWILFFTLRRKKGGDI